MVHSLSTLLNGNDQASILSPLPLPTAAGLIKLESFHIQGLKPAAALLSFHILRFVNSLSVVYPLGSSHITKQLRRRTIMTVEKHRGGSAQNQNWIHTTSISISTAALSSWYDDTPATSTTTAEPRLQPWW
jgi:hypothetical protein